MTGCRHGAKNTLIKNYLYLAEQAGRRVHPLTTVDRVSPACAGGGYVVTRPAHRRRLRRRKRPARCTADQVVFAAAALGTQSLLHRMRDDGPPAAPVRPARAT